MWEGVLSPETSGVWRPSGGPALQAVLDVTPPPAPPSPPTPPPPLPPRNLKELEFSTGLFAALFYLRVLGKRELLYQMRFHCFFFFINTFPNPLPASTRQGPGRN